MDESRDLVPTHPDTVTTPADVLAALDAAAVHYLAENRETNTRRAYDTDWRVWQHYCTTLGIDETANTIGALVGFIKWLQDKPPTAEELALDPDAQPRPQAPSTIDRRLAGVVVTLTDLGHEPPGAAKKAARQALSVYRKQLTKDSTTLGRGRAPAATVGHLHRITAACPDTLAGHRDRVLVLVGFRVASRSAEIAGLLLQDIEDVGTQGIVVTIRFGKTGGRRVPIPPARDPDVCPVLAWRAWRDRAGYSVGPAFPQIDKMDQIRRDEHAVPLPLGPGGVRGVIGRAARRAGVTEHLTGHSLRAGFATEARRRKHDAKTISAVTGHAPNSAVLHQYFRAVDEWEEAPDDIL
jgi:integrase